MDQKQQRWLDDYLAHLRNERNLSGHTIAAYRRETGRVAADPGVAIGVDPADPVDPIGAGHLKALAVDLLKAVSRRLAVVDVPVDRI